jgi:hypothetical protein
LFFEFSGGIHIGEMRLNWRLGDVVEIPLCVNRQRSFERIEMKSLGPWTWVAYEGSELCWGGGLFLIGDPRKDESECMGSRGFGKSLWLSGGLTNGALSE